MAQILTLCKIPLTYKIENHIIVRMKGNGVCGILGQDSLLVDDYSMKEGRKEYMNQ